MKKNLNLISLAIALAVVYAIFCFLVPNGRFARLDNVELMLRQSTIVAAAAIGMSYVIIGGGIDLSVGSTAALASVVVALALQRSAWDPLAGSWLPSTFPVFIAWPITHLFALIFWPWNTIVTNCPAGILPLVAAGLGALSGAICGLVNGMVITRFKVVPFIVTLGTLLIIRAVAKGVAHEQRVDAPDNPLNNLLAKVGKTDSWHFLPWGVWIVIGLALIMALILRNTRFGRHVIAVGSNEAAARLSGVNIDWVKLRVYILAGLFAGIAGLMQFSRLTVGDPTVDVGLELDAIAAVVIGGASLAGGEGSIFGAMIGALVMQTIRSGGSQMGLPNWVQEIVTGTIIVIAVALDRWRARRSSSKAD